MVRVGLGWVEFEFLFGPDQKNCSEIDAQYERSGRNERWWGDEQERTNHTRLHCALWVLAHVHRWKAVVARGHRSSARR